jgi:uncharacterized protein with NRDE domain
MCLLLFFYKQIPGYPLVLCANRDEYFDRPAKPPSIQHPDEGVPFLAPRDLRAGGTWIGMNQSQGIAAITNRKGLPVNDQAPSRGILCADVLAQGSGCSMVIHGLDSAGRDHYNGFNLLLADPEHAWLLVGGGSQVQCLGIEPGVHVLTNEHELDALTLPPQPWWETPPASEAELLERLIDLLKGHDALGPDGFAPCKHFENRGTRSATIILIRPEGVRYLFADGPPCEAPFEDLTAEAQALVR